MRLADLTEIWIVKPTKENVLGEYKTTWKYSDKEWVNVQQDADQYDISNAGLVDYGFCKIRTDKTINLAKGDGVCFNDISKSADIIPEYRVVNANKIGRTWLYRMEVYNGT